MSFKLLDFVNNLIIEDLLESSVDEIVNTTKPEKLPSSEQASRLLSFTKNALQSSRQQRLTEFKEKFQVHKKESLYAKALRYIPSSVDKVFAQVLNVVATQGNTVPESWTYAHRGEKTGKDNDKEMRKIWIRMYMLGLINNKSAGS